MNPDNPVQIDLTDLQALCLSMGASLDIHELSQAMYDLDVSGEMHVRLDDFVQWWVKRLQKVAAENAAIPEIYNGKRLWEHVIELDESSSYYFDHITGEVRWTLPELVQKIMEYWEVHIETHKDERSMDEKLHMLFTKFDVDSSRSLDLEEWHSLLVALGVSLPSRTTTAELMHFVNGKLLDTRERWNTGVM
jgi:Ca2+-binding EF-hand superfamily protein